MTRIYWCEFPDQVDWKKLALWVEKDDTVVTYITCTSRKDFEEKRKKINKISKRITVNAWPTLPFKEGYWFSSFTSKKMIDTLEQYRGIDFKLDIEPPKPKEYTFLTAISWIGFNLLKKGKNKEYLQKKIISLSKDSKIILSTFPLPKFLIKRWGWINKENIEYNFMHYSSFIPRIGLWKYNMYHRLIVSPKHYVALGLIGTGIFKNEPTYKKIEELKRDITYFKKKKFTKFVFFRLGAIVDKGKEWFDTTKV